MADKLGEYTWTSFTKKQKLDLDDGPLVKALARFDKTDESKPEPRKAALEDVIEQIKRQVVAQTKRKKELGDKMFGEVKDKLSELLASAEKALKETEAALDKANEDDEEDSPALLTKKMVPLLRELRKGELRMAALICTAGKNTAVLIMRRTISNTRRKMLADAVDATGGMKYIVGECLYENKALTFVVQSPAAGLAKRLRQALLDQTELRLKVVVRGDDGEEGDGDDEEAEAPGETGEASKSPTAGPSPSPDVPPGGPASAEALAYTQRRRKLEERLQLALQAQHPEATRLRGVSLFADEKAQALDYAGALKALEMLEKLLAAPWPGAAGTATGGVDPGVAFKARMSALIPRLKDAPDARLKASEAGVFAGRRDFAQADALLDEVEALLEGRSATPSPGPDAKTESDAGDGPAPGTGPSLVQQRVFMLTRWKKISVELDTALAGLKQAITANDADDEPAELVDAISGYLKELLDDVQDGMDDAINAGDASAFKGLADRVSGDDMMQLLADNPVIDGKAFRDAVLVALREIEANLAG